MTKSEDHSWSSDRSSRDSPEFREGVDHDSGLSRPPPDDQRLERVQSSRFHLLKLDGGESLDICRICLIMIIGLEGAQMSGLL